MKRIECPVSDCRVRPFKVEFYARKYGSESARYEYLWDKLAQVSQLLNDASRFASYAELNTESRDGPLFLRVINVMSLYASSILRRALDWHNVPATSTRHKGLRDKLKQVLDVTEGISKHSKVPYEQAKVRRSYNMLKDVTRVSIDGMHEYELKM